MADRVQELKKLNRSLIVQYLDLLDVLEKNPSEYGKHIENISTILLNMHHILNAYRPHQVNGSDTRHGMTLLTPWHVGERNTAITHGASTSKEAPADSWIESVSWLLDYAYQRCSSLVVGNQRKRWISCKASSSSLSSIKHFDLLTCRGVCDYGGIPNAENLHDWIKALFFFSLTIDRFSMIFVPVKNCKPGVAKVSFGELSKLGVQPGAWVKVLDGHGKVSWHVRYPLEHSDSCAA